MRQALFTSIFALLLGTNCLGQGFVENQGQWTAPFSHRVGIRGGSAYMKSQSILFHLVDRSGLYGPHGNPNREEADDIEHHHAFELEFIGSRADAIISGEDDYPFYVNYYLGKDPSRWKSNIIPTHELRYSDLYKGIDLVVRENGNNLKYAFEVDSGIDYRDIRIKVLYADGVKLDRHGNIVIQTAIGDLVETKPVVYQEQGKKRWEVEASFVLAGNTISYSIPDYDTNLALIIDPELIFSSFSGSTSDNWGYTATPDQDGNLYAGSSTLDDGYPTTTGAFDTGFNGASATLTPSDITISKFDDDGTDLIYSTYLGGDSADIPHSLIVDENNTLFVLGTTSSDNYPTSTNAYDDSFNGGNTTTAASIAYNRGSDIVVTRFNASGTALIGSTYLGGSDNDGLNISNTTNYNYADEIRGEINLDNDGNVIIVSCSRSDNYPVTTNAFQPSQASQAQDGVISKLNSNLSSLIWSSYLGGIGTDACYGVAIADDNSVYVCGGTASQNFPAKSNAFQSSYGGGTCDGFIAHITENGTNLQHCTYFGSGAYDQMFLIQLDRNDHPHVFGQTENSGSHFISNAAFNDVGGGQVLAHFKPDLQTTIWRTQFGSTPGQPNISPTSFLVDVCNSVYLAGWGGNTQSNGNNNASDVAGLPVTNDAFKQTPDNIDSEFYLCVLDADANTQTFGSFYGGDQSGAQTGEHVDGGTSRFDRSGKIYQAVCAGCGSLSNFPIEPDPGAWSTTNESNNCNLGVFKIDFELPVIIADFNAPNFGCVPFTVNFDNQSVTQNATTFFWEFGNGSVSTSANPNHTYNQKGTYTVRLIVSDPNSCNLHDTLLHTIVIKDDTSYTITPEDTCIGTPIEIGPNPDSIGDVNQATINWSPAIFLDNPNTINPTATVNQTTTFTLTLDYGGCQERITQVVEVDNFDMFVSNDTIVCSSFTPFRIHGEAPGINATYEWSSDPEFTSILSTDTFLNISTLDEAITKFYFKSTKDNGCTKIDTVQVTVSDWDLYLLNDTAICQGDAAILEARSNDPANIFHYFWTLEPYKAGSNQDLLTDTTNNFITIQQTEATRYYLYAKSAVVIGCNVRDSIFVQVSALSQDLVSATAEKDSFYLGESVQLTGSPGEGFYHSWSPGKFLSDSTATSPTAKPKEAMQYVYTVSDRDIPDCSFKDSLFIYPYEIICGEPEVFLPTAFSPNRDGINEELKLLGKNIETVDMAIYDRWGKLMFETNDKNKGWDGMYKGNEAEATVYVYYYDVRCIDNQRVFRKGNITLLR